MKVILIAQVCIIFYLMTANVLNSEPVKEDTSPQSDERVEGLQGNTDKQAKLKKTVHSENEIKRIAHARSSGRRRRRRYVHRVRRPCRPGHIYSYKEYTRKLKKLGLSNIPGIKIQKASHQKILRQPARVYGRKRCYKRKGKRSYLYDLCHPCIRPVQVKIHPSINAVIRLNEVDCKNQGCIKFGKNDLGKCVPFIHEVRLPVPNGQCGDIIFETFKWKIACVCKAYRPF